MIPTRELAVIYIRDAGAASIEWHDDFGYRVIFTQPDVDFVALIRNERPAAVIVDITDTLTVLEQLGDNTTVNQLLIAVVDNDTNQIEAAFSAGAVDCLIRPVQPLLLQHRIEALIKDAMSKKQDDKYRRLFDSANDAMFINDLLTGSFIDVNMRAVKWLGYSRDEYLLMDYDSVVQNELGDLNAPTLMQEISTNGRVIAEQHFIHKDGTIIPAEVSSRLITYEGRRAILNFVRDISKRKKIEAAEQAQRKLAEALYRTAESLNRSLHVDDIAQKVIEHTIEVVLGETINITLLDGKQAHVYAYQGYAESSEYLNQDYAWQPDKIAPLKKIIETRKSLVVDDLHEWAGWESNPLILGRSFVGAPLITDDEIIGFLSVGHQQPGQFTDETARNLQAFANQAAIAMQNARLHEAVQKHAEELEKRVEHRTAELLQANKVLQEQIEERKSAETALQEEQALLRILIDNIPDEIYVKDNDGIIITANRPLERRLSRRAPDGKVVGSSDNDYLSEIMDESEVEKIRHEELKLLKAGVGMVSAEIQVLDEQLNPRWMFSTKIPLTDTKGEIIGLLGINHDITDIKSAEERLEHIISGAACLMWYGIATEDDSSIEVYVSSENAAQNFLPLELQAGEDYAIAWQRSILPEDKIKRDAIIHDTIENKKSGFHLEFRCERGDGEVRWLSEEVQVRQLMPGRYNLVGICTDITERREAEEALQRHNELLEQNVQERTQELRQANEVLMEQIAERNRVERAEREQRRLAEALSDASRALSETLELNTVLDRILTYVGRVMPPHDRANIELIEDEIYVHTLRRLDYREDGVQISSPDERFFIDSLPKLKQMFTQSKPFTVANTETDPDWKAVYGQEDVRSYIGVPIIVEGQVIGFITLYSKTPNQFEVGHTERLTAFAGQAGIAIKNASLFKAISDHVVELGERVQDRTRELEHERAQLAAILNAMTEGVIYSDPDGKVQYVNQSLTLLTGYSNDAWRGKRWTDLLIEKENQDHMATQAYETISRLGRWQTRTKIVRKDGHPIDASVVSTMVTGPDMIPTGSVTVIRDISAETRLEAQKARFIAIASHELRTPITNLKTRLYLLKKQPEKLQQHLDILESVTARMRKLVQDLLDVSRFEHGIIALEREKLVLQNIVEEVVGIQQAEADGKNITLNYIAGDTPAFVSADPARLTQVFTNLINNAINYTSANGKIDISLQIKHDSVEVKVRDTGVGIPAELLDDVFKPFFRVSESSSGMGLGLNITKEIIEAHDGKISVESKVDEGTCFTVKLPIITQ